MTNEIEILGDEEVFRKLDGLDDPVVFIRPMTEATAHVQNKIANYPPSPGGRPQPFKTEKQRRYFFWALRNGKITVPYKRGGTLGRKWTTEVSADGRTGRVGNNTPYARVVQDEGYEKYSHYHKETGWPTIQGVARSEERAVKGYFERQYERYAKTP
jgi:hypothetical protein